MSQEHKEDSTKATKPSGKKKGGSADPVAHKVTATQDCYCNHVELQLSIVRENDNHYCDVCKEKIETNMCIWRCEECNIYDFCLQCFQKHVHPKWIKVIGLRTNQNASTF